MNSVIDAGTSAVVVVPGNLLCVVECEKLLYERGLIHDVVALFYC